MGVSVTSNFGEALSSLQAELPTQTHVLTVANVMEYARYLHDKEGFYVFNDQQLARIVREKLNGISGGFTDEAIEGALQTAAAEYVNWLLEQSGATRPPLRANGTRRRARKGGWADVTGNLAAHYKSQVNDGEIVDHDEAAPEVEEELPEQVQDFPE